MKHGVKIPRLVLMSLLETLPERFTCDDVFRCWPEDQPYPTVAQTKASLKWMRCNGMILSDDQYKTPTYWRPTQPKFVHTKQQEDWEAFKRNPTQYLASL